MAAQSQKQQQPIEETMRNLKIDPSAQPIHSDTVPSKDGSPSDATSCISCAEDPSGSVKDGDVDHESLTIEQEMAKATDGFYGYYYPGYVGTFGGQDDQGYYVPGDGAELHQYTVMQADNGSSIYFMPGVHPGYSPYGSYLPVTMVGADGQYVDQQYSPSPMFHPSIAPLGYVPTPLPYGELVPSAYPWDPSVFVGAYGNGCSGILDIADSKPYMSSPSNNHAPCTKNLSTSELGNSFEMKSSLQMLDVSSGHSVRSQLKPPGKNSQHVSSVHSDVISMGYYPFANFPSYNQGKDETLYPKIQVRANTRGWGSTEKPKTRSKVNNISDFNSVNEQNYGQRTVDAKASYVYGGNAAGSLATDGNKNSNSVTSLIRRDQYNHPDFPTKYNQAFFFVIKSYSEDDIHKSIKYNVWASTPNGNKRLDNAYQDAQEKMEEKGGNCPVLLFFSVNASGQFCGVAEMIGRVDFDKNMEFWQQDKWNGYFPVKWHIIKDVPNPQLRHIILENNENKPVTNSRDTQEVRFPQGIEMLNIFKNYFSKTSILDDFDFYESRQKVMEEKRLRPLMRHFDHKEHKADETTGFQSPGKDTEEAQVGDQAKE